MNPLIELVIRATVLLLVGLCLWRLARNRSAEARVRLLRVVLAGLVILPAVWAIGPRWNFDIPGMKKPAPVTISLDSEIQSMLSAAASSKTQPIDTLPFIYGGIALLLLIPAVAGATILRRLWRQGMFLGWKLEDELDEALDTVGVKAAVEARLSDIPSPMVYGVFRRRLLLPRDFGDWPEDHRRLALLHESAHLKRFDCAWQHVAYGVRAVYWCHPLVWFLSRALKDETELAADERAIRSGAEAADYAAALVAIARTLQEPGRLVRSQGVTFMNHRQLDRRVVSVLHGNRRGFSSVASLALAGFVGLGTLAAAGSQPQQPQPEIHFVPPAAAQIATIPSPSVRIVQEMPAIAIAPSAGQSRRAVRGQASMPARIVASKELRSATAPSIARLAIPVQTKKGTTIKYWSVPAANTQTRWAFPHQAPAADPSKSGKWVTPQADPAFAVPRGAWIAPSVAQPAKAPKGTWVTPRAAPAFVAPRDAFRFRYEADPARAPKQGTAMTQPDPNARYQIAPLPNAKVRGVPVLQDIPLVGRFFQQNEKAAAEAQREYEVALRLGKMNLNVASQAADDKVTAELIEQIRHLHVDSARDVTAIQKFIERSAQEGKKVDRLAISRYLNDLELSRTNSIRYKTDLNRNLATTLNRKNAALSNLQVDRKASSLALTRALTGTRNLATRSDALRMLTIDTQSKKPVTLKLMIDGKEQTIEATPDANGVVRISVDEKGNIKVIKN